MADDPSHSERFNAVVDLLLRQAEADAAVTTAMGRASELRDVAQAEAMLELDDTMLASLGWTRQALIIARDAKMNRGSAPIYAFFAQERQITRLRAAQDHAADVTTKKAKAYVLVVNEKPQRELEPIDITEEDPKP